MKTLNLSKTSFYCLLLILLFSCKKENIEPQIPKINEYSIYSMFYPSGSMPAASMVKLKYNHSNKIVHRIGDLIGVNPQSGFLYRFIDDIADTLVYEGNSIIIKKHILNGENWIASYKRELLLKDGLLVRKIFDYSYYGTYYFDRYDTVMFYYNDSKQIEKTRAFRFNNRMESNFKYDENGNLSMVTSELLNRTTNDTIHKDTLLFSDYDNSPNLTKELIIFEECFFRSLSTNNFRKYSFIRRNRFNTVLTTEKRSWNFDYDKNNYPIY